MTTTLTTLLASAETWWQGESMTERRASVLRYGRAERAFHLAALLGLSGVKDLDAGRKSIQETSPHLFYDGGGVADLWRRFAPFGCAWGLSPAHGRAALTAAGNLNPDKAYDAVALLVGLQDDDASRAAAPIIRQVLLSNSTALRDDAYTLTVAMSDLSEASEWPKARTDRRRAIRLAFRTLVIDHSAAGVKVGAVLQSAEEEQVTKRANAQKTRRKAEQADAIRKGADPVGQAFLVLSKWVGDGMPEPHLPTPLPKLGKGKKAVTATRRNVYEYLSKIAPEQLATLDDLKATG
jgi:hypothetical protein